MPGYGASAQAAAETVVETAADAAADAVTAASGASGADWGAAEAAAETVVEAAADAAADAVTAASGASGADWGAAEAAAETVVEAAADAAADAVTAASGASGADWGAADSVVDGVVETVVDAAGEAVRSWAPFWDLDKAVIPWASGFVTWFREFFMDGIASHIDFLWFQGMVVAVECLIGLALIGGLFTFPAAGVSIIMCFVFIFSGLFSWSQVWFIFAAFLMLGAAGRTLGLDYWVQPWLKKWWNGTALAKRTYLYTGEPRRKRSR